MDNLFAIICIIFYQHFDISGENLSTVVPIHIQLNGTTKSALRYGFHQTSECLKFEISYLCIQKCLDLNYDVAYADKNCKCTCYIKKDKAKYSPKYNFTRTKWKLGAPTTSIPAWAQEKIKMKVNVEDNKSKESPLSREIDLDDESKGNEQADEILFPTTDNVNTLKTESATDSNVDENKDSQKAESREPREDESTNPSNVGKNTDEPKVDGNTDVPNVAENGTEENQQSVTNPTEENVEQKGE